MKLKLMLETVALSVVLSLSVPAQLNGTYTVGTGMTYATMTAAVADLTTLGVSGPVAFVVIGSHAGPITIGAFVGQGPANPVVFLGGGTAALTGTGTVLTLNGCQSVTIDGFTGAFASGSAIVIAGSYNTVRNCTFTMPVTTATSANKVFAINSGTGVTIEDNVFGGGYEAFNSAAACDQLTIQRNRLQGGGFWIGQILGTNVIVRNNFIWGNSQYGLRAGTGTTNLRILNNSFYIAQATGSSQFCALRWYSTSYGEVINNSFTDIQIGSNGNIMWCSGTMAPTVMNYNTYNLVNGLGLVFFGTQMTLAQWQATGRDLNSSIGDPGYVNTGLTPPDLHILVTSPNYLSGTSTPNVVDDIDFQPRNAIPCRGADELSPPALYAAFAVPAVTTAPVGFGPFAFTVNFTDQSASVSGPITSWAWDLNGDSIIDSTLQNPSYTYAIPGIYTVTLTVTDGVNPPATFTRSNLINAQPHRFRIFTTGGGAGDLFISPIPGWQVPTAVTGYMLISLATTQTVGTGPLFGIFPDPTCWGLILSPATVGDIFHWIATPGLFPNVGFGAPPGTLSALTGITVDGVQVDLTAAMTIANISTVSRVTF